MSRSFKKKMMSRFICKLIIKMFIIKNTTKQLKMDKTYGFKTTQSQRTMEVRFQNVGLIFCIILNHKMLFVYHV